MKLLAVDSNSVLNRAFYGIKVLTTKDGTYTNGIYGFLNILLRICEEVQPDAIACAFDLKAPTFRHKRYEGYKAQRKGMPEELAVQLPILKELLEALGYVIVACEGYEADDILGTLSAASCAGGNACVIATGDRDSLQLVNDCVTVRLATTKMGRAESTLYDVAAIEEKYGVTPKELIEVKALMGDSSDNIPGVAGIGEKTALDLIQRYHTVDYIYENLETLEIKPGVRQKLAAGREQCYLSRELAEICCAAPVPTDLGHYLRQRGNPARAYQLLARLEMFSLIEKFGLTPGELAEEESPAPQAARPLPVETATLSQVRELTAGEQVDALLEFEGDDLSGFVLHGGEKLLRADLQAPEFSQMVENLVENVGKLRTTGSKRLYRYGYKNNKDIQIVKFDGELAAYLLSPTSSDYSVGRLAAEYQLTVPPVEGEDLPQMVLDAAVFPALCDLLEQKIEAYGQTRLLAEVEQPLARVLASMEWIGFTLDTDGLQAFGAQLEVDLAQLEERIYGYTGSRFNLNSPKQLGEVLFGQLGLPTRKKTKSGYSTNADVLESLKGKHPIIGDILEYRKLSKLKSTYVEGLMKVVGEDGRVHTSFQQTETRTGRISSIEPNMQNIPVRTELGSNLRKFFRAAPGKVLVDADYSQIELRVLAHIAQDQNMIAAFASGEDIHTQTASQVFNLPPLFVTPLMRSRAKAVNFGIVYGIGAFSLSQDIGVSVAEADSYIKEYLKTYGGVKAYMENTKAKAREDGYVTTLMGRRRYLPELQASNRNTKAFGERVAMNTPIQGTAADIIKIAMIRVFDRLAAEGLASKLVLQVHDELIVESPENEAEQAARILKEEMEGAVALSVPMQVDVGTGSSWYDAK